jgi:hypothetical protein
MIGEEGLQRAGQVTIEQLKLVSSKNTVIDLTEFLVELHVYEDIFKNHLYGEILLTDSRNIIDKLNIHGEEFLNIKLKTPSFSDKDVIEKTFRVFKISNREIVRDSNTQNFTLHFVSVELFYDILLPLFVSFEGNITDVVSDIFSNYIASSRNFDIADNEKEIKEKEKVTELIIINEADNKVKFISPGWSPLRCINWLASKSIPKDGVAKNFLFFESNKNYYFGTVENLFKDAVENNNYLGKYFIAASNIRADESAPDINRELYIARDVIMTDSTDYIKNYTNGYLANRLVFLDVFNKDYALIDYDHTASYENQFHSSGAGKTSIPVFAKDGFKNPASSISFYPKNPKLFSNFSDNINEKMDQIYGNRKSSLLELTNIRMNITVPGRTDAEVGRLLYFEYPSLGAKEESDGTMDAPDELYSGYYFITSIHHIVTKNEHSMVMEIVKDSLYVNENSKNKV